jgi:hypothetical protein
LTDWRAEVTQTLLAFALTLSRLALTSGRERGLVLGGQGASLIAP